jgi:hypothetical protein
MTRKPVTSARILSVVLSMALLAIGCGGGGGPSPVPPPVSISVTVSPQAVALGFGSVQQFTALVSGTTNAAVTWSVSSIPGGNSQVGTISTAGLYTAPSAIPTPNPVTVTATSQADTSQSASATVTIVPSPSQRNVTVAAGQITSSIDIPLTSMAPTLQFIAMGICCSAGSTGVPLPRGGGATLLLVGNGFEPGTIYWVSGPSSDVTVTQPTGSDFTHTNGNPSFPAVLLRVVISANAVPGARNVMAANSNGELTVFVGGLLIQ